MNAGRGGKAKVVFLDSGLAALRPPGMTWFTRMTQWREEAMSVRLVISITAAPGKGAELAKAMAARCRVSQQDAGCEQFEVFQSALDPDRLCLLERWATAEDLAAHAKLNQSRAPLPEGLRLGAGEREDYEYNRTR